MVVDGIACGLVDYSWANVLFQAQVKQGYIGSYFDDEWWMGNMLVDLYEVAMSKGDIGLASNALTMATILLEDIMIFGWDETCCGQVKGGIWWDKNHTGKATASNMGPVILAARIGNITGSNITTFFAIKAFTFWRDLMYHSKSGRILDFVRPDGSISKAIWSYDQGLALGAGVHLSQSTGNISYLRSVQHSFEFILRNLTTPVSGIGSVLSEALGCRGGDCEEFKGPTSRYIADYYKYSNDTRAFNLLLASSNAIWNLARNPVTNVFSINWTGPAPELSATVNQATETAAIEGLLSLINACAK